MKKRFWFVTLIFLCGLKLSMGQQNHTVTIKIQNKDRSTHIGEDFFLTGLFNGWKPSEIRIGKIPSFNETVSITLENIPSGLFEYKFTRGNWHSLASTVKGTLEGPLKAIIAKDTTLYATIDAWRDDFPASTASPQVQILDSEFYFPNLDLKRRVYIYLPKDYAISKKKYPVVYMHDGQDLFDEATSKGRIGPLEWCVDETIDASKYEAIVVGIAHAESVEQRQNEYFVRPNTRFPSPVGADYLKDIVTVLKPYVDQNYRTLNDKKHTAMCGSSVGGLLTFYAGLMYPEVFGTLGILSPSIWLDEGNIEHAVDHSSNSKMIKKQRYYFYGGGNENRLKSDSTRVKMHDDIRVMADQLEVQIKPIIEVSINPEGRHGAWYWQKAFPAFFEWWNDGLKK